MYFRVNLKMKKPTWCCFTWIVFIELNFTVAFLLIRKTLDGGFAGKVGGWGILRNGGDPRNGGDDFEIGDWYPFTDYVLSLGSASCFIDFNCLRSLCIVLQESVNKLNHNFMDDLFKSSENTINLESCHLKHKASMIILS